MKWFQSLLMVCINLSFAVDLQLPKKYKSEAFEYISFEENGNVLQLQTTAPEPLFIQPLAKYALRNWKEGDGLELFSMHPDQWVVALKNQRRNETLIVHRTKDLPKKRRISARFFSIRCSGSTFMQHLLQENFPELYFAQDLGWKHGPGGHVIRGIRSQASDFDDFLENSAFNVQNIRKDLSEAIMIVRDPFNWVRSLHKNSSWVLHPSYTGTSFSNFLHRPVSTAAHQPADLDFFEKKRFADPISMRTQKLKLLIKLTEQSKNHFFINYETLVENPAAVVAHIASYFGWRSKPVFSPINHRIRGGGKVFKPTVYPKLSEEDRAFILDRLDPELEKRFGYDLDAEALKLSSAPTL